MQLERLPVEVWDLICHDLTRAPYDTLKRLSDTCWPPQHPFLYYLFHDYVPRHAPMQMFEQLHVGYMTVQPGKIMALCGERVGALVQVAMQTHGAILAGGFANGDGQATDIDLFFTSEAAYSACLIAVSSLLPRGIGCLVHCTKTFAEIYIPDEKLIQFICQPKMTSYPEVILLDFDMTYIRCALHYDDKGDTLLFTCTASYLYATLTKRTAIFYTKLHHALLLNRTSDERVAKAKLKGYRVINELIDENELKHHPIVIEVRDHTIALAMLLKKGRADHSYLPQLWRAGIDLIPPELVEFAMCSRRRESMAFYDGKAIGAILTIRRLYKGSYPGTSQRDTIQSAQSYRAEVDTGSNLTTTTRHVELQCTSGQVLVMQTGKVGLLDLNASGINDFAGWTMTGWFVHTVASNHEMVKPRDVLKGPILFTPPHDIDLTHFLT